MADRMLPFPARSSSAVDHALDPMPEELIQPDAAPSAWPQYRGLFLVKGEHAACSTAPAATRSSRISQTRRIVAQVEQEIAAVAARSQAERFGHVHPITAPRSSEAVRDTPWAVLTRLVRSLHKS